MLFKVYLKMVSIFQEARTRAQQAFHRKPVRQEDHE